MLISSPSHMRRAWWFTEKESETPLQSVVKIVEVVKKGIMQHGASSSAH